MSGYLVAIDPGFDEVALAAFDLERWRPCLDLTEAMRALGPVGLGRTLPADTWSTRCQQLAEHVTDFAAGLPGPVVEVVVEVPATRNSYRRHRHGQETLTPKNMGSLLLMHLGIGAILTGARRLGCPVLELTASATPKPQRAMAIGRVLNGLGARAKYRADEYDAMWVGWSGLCRRFETRERAAPKHRPPSPAAP